MANTPKCWWMAVLLGGLVAACQQEDSGEEADAAEVTGEPHPSETEDLEAGRITHDGDS